MTQHGHADPLRDTLEAAMADLVFSSESDRPFTFIRYPAATIDIGLLTPDEVASLDGALGAEVEEITLDELLARHIDRVDAHDRRSQGLIPRYQALRDTLRGSLIGARVFRIGRREVRCLVIGNDPATGELAGMETVAVES